MLENLQKWYKEIGFVMAVTLIAASVISFKAEAEDAIVKANQMEETSKKLTDIAEDLSDPNLWLRNYLLNHNLSKEQAKAYSNFPKGPVTDSLGRVIRGIPFLHKPSLPEIGELRIIFNDTLMSSDTLWNFRK